MQLRKVEIRLASCSYLEWIHAFFADDEGDAENAEEYASHDHHHVHHEPCLGGVAIAAQLLGRWNLVKKYKKSM